MMSPSNHFDDDDEFEDEFEDDGESVVRSFIVTNGRTTAAVDEIPIEMLVSPTDLGRMRANDLQFEARRLVTEFPEATGIAELAAVLSLPLRATQILVSELVADGFLTKHETIDGGDVDLLQRIRAGLSRL